VLSQQLFTLKCSKTLARARKSRKLQICFIFLKKNTSKKSLKPLTNKESPFFVRRLVLSRSSTSSRRYLTAPSSRKCMVLMTSVKAWVLHYLLNIHQQTYRIHWDATLAHQLETLSSLLAASCPKSVGRPLPLKLWLCFYIPLLRDWRNQQTREKIPRADLVQRDSQVTSLCSVLFRNESPL